MPLICTKVYHNLTKKLLYVRFVVVFSVKNNSDLFVVISLIFHIVSTTTEALDVCMTVRHKYNNINNQLDATITVY